jgi:hypothetical protein
VELLARDASAQSLFQPVPKSQLKALTKLPLLRQRIGNAVAQIGAATAVSRKYQAAWSKGTHKSVACKRQRGDYRCDWRFQLKGTPHAGYVLIGVTASSYHLEKVVQTSQALQPPTALSPLWYILIAVAAVSVVIATVTLLRRRRRSAMARR